MSRQHSNAQDLEPKKRIVLTGSECTGKTRLVQALAEHFGCPCSQEAARAYLDKKGAPLNRQDIEPIARQQIALEDTAASQPGSLVIHDTDLLSTMIYAQHYYHYCPDWIIETAQSRARGLYLLCDSDLPWIPDGLQRDQGLHHQRSQIQALFVTVLRKTGQHWSTIGGLGQVRTLSAIATIENFLDSAISTHSNIDSQSRDN